MIAASATNGKPSRRSTVIAASLARPPGAISTSTPAAGHQDLARVAAERERAAAGQHERQRGGEDQQGVLVAAGDRDSLRGVDDDTRQEESLPEVVEKERGGHDG